MSYDAVIFDLFGTLVDQPTLPGPGGAEFRRAMSAVAATLSVGEADLLRLWSETTHQRDSGFFPTMETYFEHLCLESGIRADAQQLSRAVGLRLEYLRGALTPRHDSLDTIMRLKASGHKIGLISDCSADTSILWPQTPLAPLIDVAILSCDVGLTKPDPRIYRMAVEGLQVSPERCLYIGDGGSNELTGASQTGMAAALIRAPYDTVAANREDWPGARISSVSDVLALATGQPLN